MRKVLLITLSVAIVLAAVFMFAAKAVAQEPTYNPEWGYYDCWEPHSWVGLTFVHPTITKDDILRAVLYIYVPNWVDSTRVFDYQWSFYTPQNEHGTFMSAVYNQPGQPYTLKACVYDLDGAEYCTTEDLAPACPFAVPQVYMPAMFK